MKASWLQTLGARIRGHSNPSRALARTVRPRGRIRVTREGWLFILISLAVGLAAIRSGNNLLFLVLGMMLGLLVVSGILSELTLRGLRVDRVPPPALEAARPFLMGISLTNIKRRVASFSIEVEDIQENRVLDKRCYFLKIPAGRTQSTAYRHAFTRRGVYRFGGFKISTKFPFALLRKSRFVALPSEVVVRPAVRRIEPRFLESLGRMGLSSSTRRGRAGDLYGLRELVPGDDLRDIHWRSSAHRGRLLVREREAARSSQVLIRLDHRIDLPEGTPLVAAAEAVEQAISTAASIAVALLRSGVRVGLATCHGRLPVDDGQGQVARILEMLARLPYADATHPLPETRRDGLTVTVHPGGRLTVRGPDQPTAQRSPMGTPLRDAAPPEAGLGPPASVVSGGEVRP